MRETRSKIGPIALIVVLLAAAGIFGQVAPGGKNKRPSYEPGDGERGYSVTLGAISTLNVAKAYIKIDNAKRQEEILYGGTSGQSGNGPGIYARGFTAKAGTKITIDVHRVGKLAEGTRFGQIGCSILEDGDQKSHQQSNDPTVSSVHCAWIVGSKG